MNRETRIALGIGAIVLFGLGLLFGLALGGAFDDDELAAPSPSPVGPTTTETSTLPTPTPGDAPAISSEGQILQEGDRPVILAAPNAVCGALLTPGTLGDCGEVVVAGQRVVWTVEQTTTPTGGAAFAARLSTYVTEVGGWVEWLGASDPAGERWSDVNVVEADLTTDGVPELLVGFRSIGDRQTLQYDVVGYSESAVPEVLAHPDPAVKGSVIVSAGTIQEYSAQYPNNEPVCCPPSFLRRMIAFQDAYFRVVGSETVVTMAVPPSQL